MAENVIESSRIANMAAEIVCRNHGIKELGGDTWVEEFFWALGSFDDDRQAIVDLVTEALGVAEALGESQRISSQAGLASIAGALGARTSSPLVVHNDVPDADLITEVPGR